MAASAGPVTGNLAQRSHRGRTAGPRSSRHGGPMDEEIHMVDPPGEAWEISRLRAKESIESFDAFFLVGVKHDGENPLSVVHVSTGDGMTAMELLLLAMYEIQACFSRLRDE